MYLTAFLPVLAGKVISSSTVPREHATDAGSPATAGFDEKVHPVALVTSAERSTDPPEDGRTDGDAERPVTVGGGPGGEPAKMQPPAPESSLLLHNGWTSNAPSEVTVGPIKLSERHLSATSLPSPLAIVCPTNVYWFIAKNRVDQGPCRIGNRFGEFMSLNTLIPSRSLLSSPVAHFEAM